MAEPYTDEELAELRKIAAANPLISHGVRARLIATLDAHAAAHREELARVDAIALKLLAERDARIAELEAKIVEWRDEAMEWRGLFRKAPRDDLVERDARIIELEAELTELKRAAHGRIDA